MNTKEKFYKRNWFIYLMLFIFPPVGIILLWIYNKRSTKAKAILSVISAIWLIIALSNDSPPTTDTATELAGNESTIETAETSSLSEEETENIATETDLDIITRAGHPTYYGSVAFSHVIWDDVPKNKIIFGDKSATFGDETILSMNAYRNSDLIRGICICFSNFENPPDFTIEDVLPIVASYMPFDVIEEYYHYNGSKLLVPNDDNEQKQEKYYILSYGLTDEGSEAYYNKIHEYSGSIDVIIITDENNIVDNFYIDFGTPRWMYNLTLNSYHRETWECNLTDYIQGTAEGAEEIEPEQESILTPESDSEIPAENITDNAAPLSDPNTDTANNSEISTAASNNFNTHNNTNQQESAYQYVLNTNTKRIHIPSCSSVAKISPQNYGTSNQSTGELELQGYQRCGNCLK